MIRTLDLDLIKSHGSKFWTVGLPSLVGGASIAGLRWSVSFSSELPRSCSPDTFNRGVRSIEQAIISLRIFDISIEEVEKHV